MSAPAKPRRNVIGTALMLLLPPLLAAPVVLYLWLVLGALP